MPGPTMRLRSAAALAVTLSSVGGSGCLPLFHVADPPTSFAAVVRAKATTLDGTGIAEGCEAGTALDATDEERSLGANVLRVPETPGLRVRLTLRFENIEKLTPDELGPDDFDRFMCRPGGVTRRESRPVPLGCHAALHVVGPDPAAEITAAHAIVENGAESGLILDVTVRHAGVLRVQPRGPCPQPGTFDLLTIGKPNHAVVAQ
jgi:hypothetical protein